MLVAFLSPTRFTSTARLMPPDAPTGEELAMLGMLARFAGSAGSAGGESFVWTTASDLFLGVLSSRTVQNGVIQKLDLRSVYGSRTWGEARKQLSRRTDISVERRSRILVVQVTDHDPRRAMAIAQEYVSQLNNIIIQLNASYSHRERVFLEQRLDQVRTDLESAENELGEFASNNSLVDAKEQTKTTIGAAASLEGYLIAEETELQGLRQIYGDDNARVRTKQARIIELMRQKQKLGGNPSASASGESQPEFYPSIRKLPLLGAAYIDLLRRVKVEERIFEILTQKYERAKVQEVKDAPSVKLLDAPELSDKKIFPLRTLIVAIGICLGFSFCVVWIFARSDWDQMDPQDPGKLLALNVCRAVRAALQPAATAIVSSRAGRFVNRS